MSGGSVPDVEGTFQIRRDVRRLSAEVYSAMIGTTPANLVQLPTHWNGICIATMTRSELVVARAQAIDRLALLRRMGIVG